MKFNTFEFHRNLENGRIICRKSASSEAEYCKIAWDDHNNSILCYASSFYDNDSEMFNIEGLSGKYFAIQLYVVGDSFRISIFPGAFDNYYEAFKRANEIIEEERREY